MDEGSLQGVAGGTLGAVGGMNSGADGALNTVGVQVMPLDRVGAGVY